MRIGAERNGRGGGCALCSGPKRHKQASSVIVTCTVCGRGVCPRHARWSEGQAFCTGCLRSLPADVQRAAIKVG